MDSRCHGGCTGTSAMGFNRIVDKRFDNANPRTSARALPAGEVKLVEAWVMVILAAALFFFACSMLNTATLILSPFVPFLSLFFIPLPNGLLRSVILCWGLPCRFPPLGGWVALSGELNGYPYALSFGVLFWVAGFDAIYAGLDADYDRKAGLYSLPARCSDGEMPSGLAGLVFTLLACFFLFYSHGFQSPSQSILFYSVLSWRLLPLYTSTFSSGRRI